MDPLQIPAGAFLIYVAVYLFMGACVTYGFVLTFGVTFATLWLFGRYIKWSEHH